jgi:hypothetical protein
MIGIVGLRHDIDTTYFGLRLGLPIVIELERKFNVRSTLFVRAKIIKSDRDRCYLRRLEREGWEIGLHLDNTVNTPKLPSPGDELKFLTEEVGLNIRGVTPHGGLIGWKGNTTWKIMDSLGLRYMEGYGTPPNSKTPVIPTHISFDIDCIRNYGENFGMEYFKKNLNLRLENKRMATVLTHPEWFVLSVGLPCRNEWIDRSAKVMLTLLRKRIMRTPYEHFIVEYSSKVNFLKYIELI